MYNNLINIPYKFFRDAASKAMSDALSVGFLRSKVFRISNGNVGDGSEDERMKYRNIRKMSTLRYRHYGKKGKD